MGTIHLHPDDRAKYGTPETGIPFDLSKIGLRQRAAFQREIGKPYGWFLEQLDGVPELDAAGNPIPDPVIDPATGEQKVEDGEPVFTPRLARDPEVLAMFVWLAMWGAGVKTPWDTFEIIANGLDVDGGDDQPGKADEPTTDSASTTNDPS